MGCFITLFFFFDDALLVWFVWSEARVGGVGGLPPPTPPAFWEVTKLTRARYFSGFFSYYDRLSNLTAFCIGF